MKYASLQAGMRQEGYSADAVIRIQYYTYKKPQDYFFPAAFAAGFIGERQETAMKIDRILEIIIYIVNHDNVSAVIWRNGSAYPYGPFKGIWSAFPLLGYRYMPWEENMGDTPFCRLIR